LILIGHPGDGRFDHLMNVLKLELDSPGRVRRLFVAPGRSDDLKVSRAKRSLCALHQPEPLTCTEDDVSAAARR
jgi:hypothetical protein